MKNRIATLAIAGALSLGLVASALAQPGTSPQTVQKGGTGASTAAGARANLGVIIGTNVQAYDAELAAIAGLTSANNKCFYWTGTGTAANYDCTSFGRGVSNAADATALRVLAGAVIGTDVQAFSAKLSALAGLSTAADKCMYWTGSSTAAVFDCLSWARSVIGAATVSAGRTAFGLAIGTDVQAFDAELAAIAGLTSANNKCFYWTGSGTAANYDCTSFGRGVSNAADATALRVLAGAVIGTDVQAFDAELAAIAGLTSANNKCFYWTGSGTAANYDCTSFGRGVSNAADATALRVLAGAVIGTDVQAFDAELAAIAGLTSANNKCFYWTGSGTAANYDCTSFGRSFAGSADAAAGTAALNGCVGDAGSGGTKGMVPAPGAGDAAASKVLYADCTWKTQTGGGGSGATDSERQNSLLALIYQSKSFAGYRRLIHLFADGYKATDGVNAGSSSNYSVTTGSGYVAPTVTSGTNQLLTNFSGYTNGAQTISTTSDTAGFEAWRASDANAGTYWQSGSVSGAATWKIDFGSSKTIVSSTMQIRSDATSAGPTAFTIQGSTNDSSYTTLYTASGLTWTTNGETKSQTFSVTGSYRYYKVVTTASGNGATVGFAQLVLLTADSTDNMIVVGTAQTADSTVSNGRVLLEYNPIDSITLNTDLTTEVTCDGGSHWASATLSNAGKGQAGRSVAETADTSCGANTGTSFATRIKNLNNKSVQVHGHTLTVH